MNLRKIKKLLQSEIGEAFSLNISLSTIENFDGAKALVIFNEHNADIIVNANLCKTDEQIFRAIAHETAHILMGNDIHSEEHKTEWERIDALIKSKIGIKEVHDENLQTN